MTNYLRLEALRATPLARRPFAHLVLPGFIGKAALGSAHNLDDVILEVSPVGGTLLAFKRSNNSWHGHEPFSGERRVIQFNWLTSQGNRQIAMLRHQTSASFKRLLQMFLPGRA